MNDKIIIKGAKMHNLKNIDLEIPHNQITVISGVSGSGKSSLAFDTLFAEGQRQYVESLSPYMRQFLGQKKVAEVEEIIGLAPAISVDQKALSHNPRSTVGTLTEIHDYLRILYARLAEVYCPVCGNKIEKLSSQEMIDIISQEANKLQANVLSILAPVVRGRKGEYYQLLYNYLGLGYAEARIDGQIHSLREKIKLAPRQTHNIDIIVDKFDPTDRLRLAEAIESALVYSHGLVIAQFSNSQAKLPASKLKGVKIKTEPAKHQEATELLLSANWTCPYDNFAFPELEPRLFSFNSPHGACPECSGLGRKNFFSQEPCPACQGQRLRPEALSVYLAGKNIVEVSRLPLNRTLEFFNHYYETMDTRARTIAESVLIQIISRLEFLTKVGLSYLQLSREAHTLSGGEAQRIRLSSQIGLQLSRTLYVLDEPTIGLHERDTERLIETLQKLRDKNNTVVMVEHDERSILAADYLLDLGPLAGVHGGELVAHGSIKELLASDKLTNFPQSLTLQYLQGQKKIELPAKRREQKKGTLKLRGAKANNLRNINLEIPLGRLVGLSGVSGSGKSSLLYDVLYKNINFIKNNPSKINKLHYLQTIKGLEYINKVVIIDQSPIGRTPRSNPATYTGIFTPIRDFFASLPASRERAYNIGRFSFNRSGGRCESCQGAGYNLIEMHFLPPVLAECEVCQGKRFNRETLEIEYKGKNIADILKLTINEAIEHFTGNYYITDKLKVLEAVGLGYLQIGQSATTLSGGEAQRIKIARELTHTLGKRTLYLLDEPTTGLHYQDIKMLLSVLNELINRGNSVVVIEHNMHILKSMDYLIDLGPGGGDEGGQVVAVGTPEQVASNKKSITGTYLQGYL